MDKSGKNKPNCLAVGSMFPHPWGGRVMQPSVARYLICVINVLTTLVMTNHLSNKLTTSDCLSDNTYMYIGH